MGINGYFIMAQESSTCQSIEESTLTTNTTRNRQIYIKNTVN